MFWCNFVQIYDLRAQNIILGIEVWTLITINNPVSVDKSLGKIAFGFWNRLSPFK